MTQAEAIEATPPPAATRKHPARIALRIATIICVTFAWGWVLNKTVSTSSQKDRPPGFVQGMLHGAMMPGAMPTLLLGKDVTIYAPNNAGRLYKLGYTLGVNACGAFFFGAFYYRINRWRKAYGSKR